MVDLELEIFVPLRACTCVFQTFLDLAMKIIIPYKNRVHFDVKDATSLEADNYGIFQNAIVVNKKDVYTDLARFEYFLKEFFHEN